MEGRDRQKANKKLNKMKLEASDKYNEENKIWSYDEGWQAAREGELS